MMNVEGCIIRSLGAYKQAPLSRIQCSAGGRIETLTCLDPLERDGNFSRVWNQLLALGGFHKALTSSQVLVN